MSRTRSKNTSLTKLDRDDQESPESPDAPPKASSFKGQITKYQYTEPPPPPTNDVSAPARPQRLTKRTRTIKSSTKEKLTSTTTSPRPKKKRTPSKYAPPSTYAHLPPLTDILTPNLIAIFVGTNPGLTTATHGHAYAHPSNHFWRLLHASGLTDRRLRPEEDRTLPALYCMGNTNIVARASRDAAELSRAEMLAGAAVLDGKVGKWRPEAVCLVGKGIWEAVWRWRLGRGLGREEFRYGWQDERWNMGKGDGDGWEGARVFVATSTSGLAASLKPKEKEDIWRPFGEWVCRRRRERGFVPGGGGEGKGEEG